MDGLEHTLRFLKSKGVNCYLLSGSIWQIIQEALGEEILDLFDDIQCNLLSFDKAGIIDRIAGTKYDFESKGTYINALKSEHELNADEILFVGNSYNDSFVKTLSGAKTLLVNPEGTHAGSTDAWDAFEPVWSSVSDVLKYVRVASDALTDDDVFMQAVDLLNQYETFSTKQFQVVGEYLRYDKDHRETLIALADRIRAPCLEKRDTWQNFLICASPGSGKTFFVEQLHKDLKARDVQYFDIDISRDNEEKVLETLKCIQTASNAALCMIDEIDGREKENWVYDSVYKYLDLNKSASQKPTVFVLIGSGTGKMEHLLARIAGRLKGPDLLDRIPDSPEFRISLPGQVLGDKLICFISRVVAIRPEIKRVEKFALYYLLGTYGKKSPRQLAALAERSAQCVKLGETVLRFDHVISAGSGEKEAFVKIHHKVQTEMARHLLTLT